MKLKVRVKGILTSILENTDLKIVPIPFIVFLGNMIHHKTFMPDNFLTEFELNRLQLDDYGALFHPDEDQSKMILGFYIMGKILTARILMQPDKLGFQMDFNEKMRKNFKILASMVYLIFLEFIF